MINEAKLNKLLKKIATISKPIDEIGPTSCDDLTKKYKKKDYEQLVHLTYSMFSCLQEATTSIKELYNSFTSANVDC